MTRVANRVWLARASALAIALSFPGFASAGPDTCGLSGTAETCSGNQSDGIFLGLLGPPQLTSLTISNLTSSISPTSTDVGVQYLSLLAGNPGTAITGFAPLPLLVTTDGSQSITASSANFGTTAVAVGINVLTESGAGGDGALTLPDGSFTPLNNGGAGGNGGDVTVNNLDNITADSSARVAETRAEEFGEEGELSGIPGDISEINGWIAGIQNGSIGPGDFIYAYLQGYYSGLNIDTSTSSGLIDALQEAITNLQILQTSLNGIPFPQETSQLILGGISVTSIGGNGGTAYGLLGTIGYAHVGVGGAGGTGGTIAIINGATIQATGPLVAGIFAESIGGNGGDSPSPEQDGPGDPNAGFGGQAGMGGTIAVTNSGTIVVTGDSSTGIFAESLGGLAGEGGPPGDSNPNYTPAGGTGGLVTVNNPGVISTNGVGAYGIFAESLGGAGISGGDAKAGGAGGNVVVDVSGQITTAGDYAYGVFGRSVGGAGGNGSDDGNSGGTGGTSALVTITVDKGATISTSGDNAIAVYGQSEGGNGGIGGNGGNVFWSEAGGGGNGGVGGDVHVSNAGTLMTTGAYAYGLFGQALGGVGGLGGDAAGLVSFSGSGGGGTPAGNVVADNSGTIETSGIGANALYAQSVAGSGGDAGSSGGFVSLGSNGGDGAEAACQSDPTQCLNGGTVTVTNEGTLITQGDSATAIFAESIGGGGGNGGGSSGVFSFGGDGGAGGNGGNVLVTNESTGQISVSGSSDAMGIFAQSVGGGGGAGGNATSGGTEVSVAIGGSGGSGGNGGNVSVTNNGAISVDGFSDTAIFVQSVGGGGGNGGNATAISANGVASASVAIGGSGGGGGNGELVTVLNAGTITTAGDFSNAIFAQSVGGGGGHGGEAFALSFAAGGGDVPAFAASLAIGGNGGDGGTGGEVDVTNSGSITTIDWNAMGIFAQSVGGSGGDGGSSSAEAVAAAPEGASFAFSLAIGGNGGSGNIGGPVSVINTGSITTFGDLSPAVFVQSVGGSGGNGGDGSASSTSLLSKNSVDIDISVGGNGGTGGDGGTAYVNNSGSILTMGAMSPGVTAQSIGAGGGNGGDGVQGDLIPGESDVIPGQADVDGHVNDAAKKLLDYQKEEEEQAKGASSFGKEAKEAEKGDEGPDSFGLSLGIGGKGGAAGDGELAWVINTGDITTLGWMSNGIFAQSVGGGGGSGGDGSAMGSDDVSGAVGVGGTGNAAGNGGTVTVSSAGDITTYGDISFGIMAQSVGGGGGAGGSGSGSSTISASNMALSVSVGGNGGAAGNGGSVSVQETGNVVTLGLGSIGIFGQSVGGGGGSAGSGIADEFNLANVHVGGSGGANGDGLDVTVTLVSGSIETTGDYAPGIFAQSIGGGGGMVGELEAVAPVASDPFGGLLASGTSVPYIAQAMGASQPQNCTDMTSAPNCGGPIVVHATGTIATYGKDSYGIFAQSVAGGGGVGPFTANGPALIGSAGGSGNAETVSVTQSGSVEVYGQDSIGIFAQSMDASGRGANITVQVDGIVQGGTGAGAGIFMSGGDQNTLTVASGANVSALSGLAIIASDGDDTVDNFGTITGSVGLGGGANSFVNEQSGLFESGAAVYVGAGSTLTNMGTLSPAGVSTIGATEIVGNYVQTATGTLLTDVDFTTGASDLVIVHGNASLAGTAELGPVNIASIKPGEYFTVLTATGTLTNNGISIANTLTVNYGVKFVGSNFEVGVNSVQFDLGGPLSTKEKAISNDIQAIWSAGGTSGMAPFLDYLAGLTNASVYQQMLDRLDPSTGLNQRTETLFAGASAVNSLMSCPGTENADDALHEHECVWARASGNVAHSSGDASAAGFDASGYDYAMGEQVSIAPEWFLGVTAGIAQNATRVETLAQESSQSFNAGVVAKHETGDWLFASAIDAQYGWNMLTRFVDFPAPTTIASSSPDTLFLDGRLRVAYLFSAGNAYFKPWVAADGYYMDSFGYDEHGAGPLDLIVAQSGKTFGSGTVGMETGLLEALSDKSSVRPYVSADITAYTDNSWDIAAQFDGAPPGTPDFTVANKFPSMLARIAGGLEVNIPGGSFRLEYENRFGDHYSDQTGSLKLRFPL